MIRALDICSGAAGGWSLGLHRAGIETMAACEAVDWRRAMYAANFPGVRIYNDLRTLTGARLLGDLGAVPDWIVGSPPCPEFSSVNTTRRGRGLGADDLFLHAVRVAGECKSLGGARRLAFENSPELRTVGYDRIASELETLGYTCWAFVVGAGNAGAPHRRPRAFVVAADLSQEQRRPSRQPRPDRRVAVAPDPYEEGHGAEPVHGEVEGLAWARPTERWPAAALDPERSLGPAWSQPLGSHLREYAGLPARLAERCREAYGDAVLPQLTELVARAILQTDAALADMAAPKIRRVA
jgi:DNA (cytosine-5)-methyltransferase 1